MIWAYVAMGLLVTIMAFKIVGTGALQLRWMREDGASHETRRHLGFLLGLWGGLAITWIGSLLDLFVLKAAGIAVAAGAMTIPVLAAAAARRRARRGLQGPPPTR